VAQEAREKESKLLRELEVQNKRLALERKRKVMESRIASIKAEFEAEEAESLKIIGTEIKHMDSLGLNEKEMAASRKVTEITS
ncbi:MAG: hypothetical protein WCE64_16595, partial [Bacteroidales bacterium]